MKILILQPDMWLCLDNNRGLRPPLPRYLRTIFYPTETWPGEFPYPELRILPPALQATIHLTSGQRNF